VEDDNGGGIECKICKHWLHPKCADITDNEYDVLTTHQTRTVHWYSASCNNKSVQMLQLVFGLQDRLQKVESDLGSVKNEIAVKISKIKSEYDAVREDLKNLSQKIDVDIKQCKDDSIKQIRSLQNETQNEIEQINKTRGQRNLAKGPGCHWLTVECRRRAPGVGSMPACTTDNVRDCCSVRCL